MRSARRRVAVTGAVMGVVIVSLAMLLARASSGTTLHAPPADFTPVAFVYEPIIFRDYAPSTATPTNTPTPTATPTSTPTPIPTHARLHLCCFDHLREICLEWCGGQVGYLGPGESFKWQQSSGLPRDIIGTTYEFGIAASSPGTTTFEVELFLIQQDQELLLASTRFTVESPLADRYVLVVEGIDPAVVVNEDRLKVSITNVSGTRAPIYSGDPDRAEAGGSYVEFPQSR
jgi:hypothetical protein